MCRLISITIDIVRRCEEFLIDFLQSIVANIWIYFVDEIKDEKIHYLFHNFHFNLLLPNQKLFVKNRFIT